MFLHTPFLCACQHEVVILYVSIITILPVVVLSTFFRAIHRLPLSNGDPTVYSVTVTLYTELCIVFSFLDGTYSSAVQ